MKSNENLGYMSIAFKWVICPNDIQLGHVNAYTANKLKNRRIEIVILNKNLYLEMERNSDSAVVV